MEPFMILAEIASSSQRLGPDRNRILAPNPTRIKAKATRNFF
jgi:hypothetical protein